MGIDDLRRQSRGPGRQRVLVVSDYQRRLPAQEYTDGAVFVLQDYNIRQFREILERGMHLRIGPRVQAVAVVADARGVQARNLRRQVVDLPDHAVNAGRRIFPRFDQP